MQTTSAPTIEMMSIGALRPYSGNALTHSKRQLGQIADSIKRFGFTNPVLVSDTGEIIAGHGRVLAARELGIESVPTLKLSHLSAEERRAYVLADNKLALNAGWDMTIELQALVDLDFDVTGKQAVLSSSGRTFEAMAAERNPLASPKRRLAKARSSK